MPQVTESVVIGRPIAEVFDFHKDPWNLDLVAPSGVRVEVVDADVKLSEGAEIKIVLYFGPIPITMVSRIESYMENKEFTEVMIKGPLTSWKHRHLFDEVPEGTRLTEIVDFEVPLGNVGLAAAKLFLGMGPDKVLSERQKNTKEYLESERESPEVEIPGKEAGL